MRADLKALEDDAEGIVFDDTHRHNTEVTIAGITYARTIEFINGYTITFEDLQYRVNLIGSNNNVTDVLNLNQVSVIPSNSAGLQAPDFSAEVWDDVDGVEAGLTPRQAMRLALAALAGRASGLETATARYRACVSDTKERITATVDADGNRTDVTTDVL